MRPGRGFELAAAVYRAGMALDRDEVLERAREWVWVPPDAVDETTDEYRHLRYPSRKAIPWSQTDRPVDDLITELLDRVTGRVGRQCAEMAVAAQSS